MNIATRVVTNSVKFDRGQMYAGPADTKIFIGWMSPTASHTNCALTFTNACTACHHNTSLTSVCRLKKFREDDIFDVWIIDSCIVYSSGFMLTGFKGCSFTCTVPSTWNSVLHLLRDTALSLSSFQKQMESHLLSAYLTLACQASKRSLMIARSITFHFIIIIVIIIIFYALVLHSQGLKISKSKNVCPE